MREELKQLAKDLKVRVKDVLALTPTYDPFYVGSPTDHKKAAWALDLYEWVLEKWDERRDELLGIGIYVGAKPHLRAIHYLLTTGRPDPRDWKGNPYEGTHAQWKELGECFKKAKILKYVPFGEIEDHKHPAVVRNLHRLDDSDVTRPDNGIIVEEVGFDRLWFRSNVSTLDWEAFMWDENRLNIERRIPVHVEVWTEKQRELVDLVAAEYWVNVQNAVGQQTYEPIYSLLKRAIDQSEGRPLRILYLSDFDPRGEFTMPPGVARLIEWMLCNLEEFEGMDVKLKKIVLTEEQVERFDLPPAPVKPTETMMSRWHDKFGPHVCEIDSIETLFATEMVEILREEFRRYVPDEHLEHLREANQQFVDLMNQYNSALQEQARNAATGLHENVKALVADVLEDFKFDFEIDVSDELAEIEDFEDYFEEPDWEVDDGDGDWLYDSSRDYGEQLVKYKEVRGW